ncbi:MAG: diguanylate cyclase [Cyanobium sp.]
MIGRRRPPTDPLQGRIHQSLWMELVVAATAAASLLAVVTGGVVLSHSASYLRREADAVQRQLSSGLTSYAPLHELQRRLQQATSSQEVEMALVVNSSGKVLAASDNALVDQTLAQVLQAPAQRSLQALFTACGEGASRPSGLSSNGLSSRDLSSSCLERDMLLFRGPLPWIGGTAVLARRQYPLALAGLDRFGDRATLITVTDAHAAAREALILTLTVFLTSLVPLMLGFSGLLLRLQARLIPELVQLAQVDALSGILNRRAFVENAEQLLQQATAHDQPIALALLDVDHFKRINDSHGHAVGDQVIRHISDLLAHAVRSSDLVGRLGGDEFVILMPQNGATATHVLERILERLRRSAIQLGHGAAVQLTLSVGVAAREPEPQDREQRNREPGGKQREERSLSELMAAADAALYVAKDRGRNRVVNLELEAEQEQRGAGGGPGGGGSGRGAAGGSAARGGGSGSTGRADAWQVGSS